MRWGRFLISVAGLCGSFSTIEAQVAVPSSVTRSYSFPPVGIGSTETASITVVNSASAASDTATSGTTTTPASCTGTVSFFNESGQMVGTPTAFTVGTQQFKTVALPFASAGLSGSSLANGNRGEIRGEVSLTTSTSTYTPCSLLLSMEIFDSTTGATHAVLATAPLSVSLGSPAGPVVPYSGSGAGGPPSGGGR